MSGKFLPHLSLGSWLSLGEKLFLDDQGRLYLSPAGGRVCELDAQSLTIERDVEETSQALASFQPHFDAQERVHFLNECGLLAEITFRPFNQLATPSRLPRCIFINALHPYCEEESSNRSSSWNEGLSFFSGIAPTHVVSQNGPFMSKEGVCHWQVCGNHPTPSLSFAIERVDSIQGERDCIWTIDRELVIAVGSVILHRRYPADRYFHLGGEVDEPGYYIARMGSSVGSFIIGKSRQDLIRLIIGSPLSGREVCIDEFWQMGDNSLYVLPAHPYEYGAIPPIIWSRKWRGRRPSFLSSLTFPSSSACYGKRFPLLLNRSLIDDCLPMRISPTHLIESLKRKNFERAVNLGVLDVIPEDFALLNFICPSKWDWMGALQFGQNEFRKLKKNGVV